MRSSTRLLTVLLLGAASPAVAQEPGERPNAPVELVDRVAAVVGDTVILYTEILEALLQSQAQGETLPEIGTPEYEALANATLGTLIDQIVLLQQARAVDITVSEDVLEAETDRRFREVRASFPSASDFDQAIQEAGRTMVQYRLYLRAQVRAQLMIQQFMQQQGSSLPPVTVSDDEVRAWFAENVEGQTQAPSLTFEQVVIRPEPSEAEEAAAREKAEEALRALRDGQDFERVARQYSEDPANRDQGGDLGWIRRSGIDADFARAAWAARTGTPIGPIRTQFGYHLIKVENVRGGERKVRHILVRPQVDEEDANRASRLAEAVADSARQGVALEVLARNHGISDEPVRLPNVPMDRLQEGGYGEYAPHLETPVPGEIVGPFQSNVRGQRFVVLKVIEFNPGGLLKYEDVKEEIRTGLTRQKGTARLVEELRSEVFVDVRL